MISDSLTPIRILIVDDNRLTVENVARLLGFEAGLEVVGTAANGRSGVSTAQELEPDVVLMDINLPDMDGIEACRQITQTVPRSRVMMMSVQSDVVYFKRAMNAGAREFLIKPFDANELVNVIRRVHTADPHPTELAAMAARIRSGGATKRPATARGERPGVMIVVIGAKGGVGCSTIAANLSIALCKGRGADVLIVDGDLFFGDLDALLDLQPVHRLTDVLELFDPDDPELVQQMLTDHPSGVHLLAAPSSPELAELVEPANLAELLNLLCGQHDYVVVDLGSRINGLGQPVLDLADWVVVVVTQEVTAIKNAHLIMSALREYVSNDVAPVLNKFNDAWGITPHMIGDVIGRPIQAVIPADGETAGAAVDRGRPVLLSAPRSWMTRQIWALESLVPTGDQLVKASRLKERSEIPISAPAREDVAPTLDLEGRSGCARWIPFLRQRSGRKDH